MRIISTKTYANAGVVSNLLKKTKCDGIPHRIVQVGKKFTAEFDVNQSILSVTAVNLKWDCKPA